MELQKRVKQFVEENKLEAKAEFRLLDIVSELGEVAKGLLEATEYGKLEKNMKLNKRGIEEELGDLMFSVMCLANTYNIDLEQALNKVLEKYKRRIAKNSSPSSKSEG